MTTFITAKTIIFILHSNSFHPEDFTPYLLACLYATPSHSYLVPADDIKYLLIRFCFTYLLLSSRGPVLFKPSLLRSPCLPIGFLSGIQRLIHPVVGSPLLFYTGAADLVLPCRPLRVRVNLRDNYYAPSSLVAEAVSSLSKELGKPVETNVDWARVWTELASDSLEASDLVPGMSNVIVALTQAVENCCTADEEWGDMLLTRLGTAGKERLDLWILVDPTIMTYEPSWISHNASIALRIPQQSAASMKAVSAMTILPSLRDIFTKAALEEPSSSKDSEWADLGVADDVKVPEQAGIGFRQGPAAMPLPNVNSLPAPESLTNKALPYMCTIFDQRGDLEVTCSHEGTLNVLATYLEVHARPNIHRTDKVRLELMAQRIVIKLTIQHRNHTWSVRGRRVILEVG